MRLATIKLHGAEVAGIVTGKGILPVAALNAYKGTGWKEDMMSLIQANHIPGLTRWYNEGGKEELETIPGVVPAEEVVYAPLYRNPKRIFGIGLNYADHAAEAGLQVPPEPIVFSKFTSCICGPDDPILIPRGSEKTDWEVELGIVIGRPARYITEDQAMDHVAGFCVINDVSERAFQNERAGQWCKGKGCDHFGPIGPWLVTADEVADPQALRLWLRLNGQTMQDGSTATMVYGVRFLVAYLSQFCTLQPGDIIATGTPPGVGMGLKPPRFLRAGDVVELGIEGLGQQRQICQQACHPA